MIAREYSESPHLLRLCTLHVLSAKETEVEFVNVTVIMLLGAIDERDFK